MGISFDLDQSPQIRSTNGPQLRQPFFENTAKRAKMTYNWARLDNDQLSSWLAATVK